MWLWCSVLAVVIPLLQVAMHKSHFDRNWPPAVFEITMWLWPTQIFFLALDRPAIINDPGSHWPDVLLIYTLSIGANILLYNLVGTIGYLVFRRRNGSIRESQGARPDDSSRTAIRNE